jgi:hypothetical protein
VRRCPRCGGESRNAYDKVAFVGVLRCQDCKLCWAEGDPGRGAEWFSARNGWTRAPAGCATVFDDDSTACLRAPEGPGTA